MINTKSTLVIAAATILVSCSQPKTETTNEALTEKTTTLEVEEELDIDALVTIIDDKRADIESNAGEATEVSTESLKAKIKQKWSKLDFYTKDDVVVRVKTYPHAAVSKRTEEFYLDNGNLILAVVEDNGEGERGKSAEQIDKMYYYYNNEVIKEVRGENEAEYSIKDGDAEELLAELKEYLDIFANVTK